MSSILFYGPAARERALEKGRSLGRIVEDSFGHPKPMKVDDARAFTKLTNNLPMSDEIPVLIVGLDGATPRTQDALLKVLEDHNSEFVRIILWARDLGEVTSTVKSRCLSQWAYQESPEELPFLEEAQELIQHLMRDEKGEATHIVRNIKGEEKALLEALAFLLREMSEEHRELWPRLRPLYENPLTNMAFIAAVVGG